MYGLRPFRPVYRPSFVHLPPGFLKCTFCGRFSLSTVPVPYISAQISRMYVLLPLRSLYRPYFVHFTLGHTGDGFLYEHWQETVS